MKKRILTYLGIAVLVVVLAFSANYIYIGYMLIKIGVRDAKRLPDTKPKTMDVRYNMQTNKWESWKLREKTETREVWELVQPNSGQQKTDAAAAAKPATSKRNN